MNLKFVDLLKFMDIMRVTTDLLNPNFTAIAKHKNPRDIALKTLKARCYNKR